MSAPDAFTLLALVLAKIAATFLPFLAGGVALILPTWWLFNRWAAARSRNRKAWRLVPRGPRCPQCNGPMERVGAWEWCNRYPAACDHYRVRLAERGLR